LHDFQFPKGFGVQLDVPLRQPVSIDSPMTLHRKSFLSSDAQLTPMRRLVALEALAKQIIRPL
jgi:hypothetical protein